MSIAASTTLVPSRAARVRQSLSITHATGAAVWFILITLAMTWPVIARAARDVTSDFGDPLLNCWILAWNAERWLRFLSGDLGAFAGYWNANIYSPHPLALAYSEHLFAQGLQILPVYALTRNAVLCYNLSFLSTFVLSALGAYLLVRELTGSARAAFVAGLIYAFAPYKIGQYPHMQVLSGQWMPFVLYGFRRYFVAPASAPVDQHSVAPASAPVDQRRRILPLAGGTLALIAQNLSCGYYLLFFAPFVALYVLYEMIDRKLLLDGRVWAHMIAAFVVVLGITLPFLLPYQQLRSLGTEPRSVDEVRAFSADVYGYLTTADQNRLWGGIVKVFVRAEGELFPGFTTIALVVLFLISHARRTWRETRLNDAGPVWRRVLLALAGVVFAIEVAALVIILAGRGGLYHFGEATLSIRGFARAASVAALAAVLMLALSRRLRVWLRGSPGSAVGYYIVALVLAWFLSFGPEITSMGRSVGPGPYIWLYNHVPGYDGLRVPARYGMLVMLFLATLGGYALRDIERRSRRGAAIVGLIGVLFLMESIPVPVPMNLPWTEEGLAEGPARVYTGNRVPAVYRYIRTLPEGTTIAEFPFGATGYELQAVFYAAHHWKPIVNGYSGGSPPAYYDRVLALRHPLREPGLAWQMLLESGATHVIVHDGAYLGQAEPIHVWLSSSGATQAGTFGTDHLYRLPSRPGGAPPPGGPAPPRP